MLATFIIGLREGLEAALIVGIVATFLRKNGTRQNLRQMWLGVAAAVLVCLGVGLVLGTADLPQRQQEMLETVIGAVAVVMITFMILWMRRHSRNLKRELESSVGAALDRGSAVALVLTAFLAVVREGFETAVFLVASSQSSTRGMLSLTGALLGIAVAVVLGYLIYRGAVRINLSRFFRATGAVLVLVAGGLLMSVLYHAHEADWINVGQQQALDLSALIAPGSVRSSLITGVFGVQPQPTWIEVIAWVLYVVPMMVIVLWPPKRQLSAVTCGRVLTGSGVFLLVAAGALALWVPAPQVGPGTTTAIAVAPEAGAGSGGQIPADTAGQIEVTVVDQQPAVLTAEFGGTAAGVRIDGSAAMTIAGAAAAGDLRAAGYAGRTTLPAGQPAGLPATLTGRQVAELNGGRLPIGLTSADLDAALPATYTDSWQPVAVAMAAGLPVDVQLRVVRTASVTGATGLPVSVKIFDLALATTTAQTVALVAGAHSAAAAADRHEVLGQVLPAMLLIAALFLLAAGVPRLLRRRAPEPDPPAAAPKAQPAGIGAHRPD